MTSSFPPRFVCESEFKSPLRPLLTASFIQIYWGAAFGDNPVNNKGLSRKHIIEGMDASLERLGLPYVDLVYAHRFVFPITVPLD